jgi:hypothetical protein
LSVGAGTGYRIRVVSNSPVVTGSNNGSDLIVRGVADCTTQSAPGTAFEEPRLMVYPNPSSGGGVRLTINGLSNADATATVEVFTLLGTRVVARELPVHRNGTQGALNTSLDLGEQLPGGVYLVGLRLGGRSYVQRLVIE